MRFPSKMTILLLIFFAVPKQSSSFDHQIQIGLTVMISEGWGPAPLLYLQYDCFSEYNVGLALNFKTFIIGMYELTLEQAFRINLTNNNSLVVSTGVGYSLSLFHHSVIWGFAINDNTLFCQNGFAIGSKLYWVDYGNTRRMGYLITHSKIKPTLYPFSGFFRKL